MVVIARSGAYSRLEGKERSSQKIRPEICSSESITCEISARWSYRKASRRARDKAQGRLVARAVEVTNHGAQWLQRPRLVEEVSLWTRGAVQQCGGGRYCGQRVAERAATQVICRRMEFIRYAAARAMPGTHALVLHVGML